MRHNLSVLALVAAQAAGIAGPALAAPAGEFVVAVHQEPQDLAAQGAYKEINAPGAPQSDFDRPKSNGFSEKYHFFQF